MRLVRLMMMVVAVLVFAVPATAAPAPQVTDECGDAATRGEWNGDGLDIEDSRSYLDIASAGVGGIYGDDGTLEAVTAALTTCGDVSASDGGYNISWSYGDRCYGAVQWTLTGRQRPGDEGLSGQIHAASGPQAVILEECYREQETPLDPSIETIYRVVLPDESVVFEGDTLRFTVPIALLPEAAAPRLQTGAEWRNVAAIAMDQGPSLWAGYGDSDGNTGALWVRTDWALGGDTYVVGEDA